MENNRLTVIVLSLIVATSILIAVLLVPGKDFGAGENSILATVGDLRIREDDVSGWAAITAITAGKDYATMDAATKANMQANALSAIVELDALKLRYTGVAVMPPETETALQQQVGTTFAQYARAYDVDSLHITESLLLDYLSKSHYLTKFREDVLAENPVADAEIEAYYAAAIDYYTFQIHSVRSSHILVGDRTHSDADREKAEEIRRRAEAGEDFAGLASEYSGDASTARQGGDIGYRDENSGLVAAYYEAMSSLGPGGISPVIESEFGFHVIKVTDIKEAGEMLSLEDVREDILGILQKNKVDTANLELRQNSDIDWADGLLIDDTTQLPSAANFE
jgi:parvulin-like peptidyl-prolyl isomerase